MSRAKLSAFRRIRPIIVVTAELTGVLTLVGTLGSVWFNSIRFGTWGLDFLEIATPGDILMSGLEVAATAGTFLLVACAFAVVTIVPVLVFRLVPVSNRRRRVILFLGFLACTAVLCSQLSLRTLPSFLSMVAAGGTIAYFALHLGKLDERPLLNLPLIALFCVSMIFQVSESVERRAAFGSGGGKVGVAMSEHAASLCSGRMGVQWVGTQAVVVNCWNRPNGNFIVIDRGDVAIADAESGDAIQYNRLAPAPGERPGPDFDWTLLGDFEVTERFDDEAIAARDYIASDFQNLRGNVRRVWLTREYGLPLKDGTVRETVLAEIDCHQRSSRILDFTDVTIVGEVRRRSWRRGIEDRRSNPAAGNAGAPENLHTKLICTAFEGARIEPLRASEDDPMPARAPDRAPTPQP